MEHSVPCHMTRREIEVLELICQGHSSKVIASLLCISAKTVEQHRDRLIKKTRAANMVQVVIYALRHNIISLDSLVLNTMPACEAVCSEQ